MSHSCHGLRYLPTCILLMKKNLKIKGLPERNRHVGERIHVARREIVDEMQVQLLHHRLCQRLAKLPQHHQHESCLYST
jgi:hypothetical protein